MREQIGLSSLPVDEALVILRPGGSPQPGLVGGTLSMATDTPKEVSLFTTELVVGGRKAPRSWSGLGGESSRSTTGGGHWLEYWGVDRERRLIGVADLILGRLYLQEQIDLLVSCIYLTGQIIQLGMSH